MKIRKKIISLVLVLSCFLSCLITTPIYANNIQVVGTYSKVMEDLEQDSNFDPSVYPTKTNDYSLEVITIAESNENELFVYVYQSNENYGKYIATSINISQSLDGHNIKNYSLTLLDYETVFQKYRIDDLAVEASDTRCYEIISIFRKYDPSIDKVLSDDNNNSINEVVYKVAKMWTLSTNNNETTIVCQDVETITVTSKYVGFVRYEDGDWWHLWGESACDRHFVAFSTDKQIDKLMEADVYFQTQSAHYTHNFYGMDASSYEGWEFGDVKDNYSYLTYTQKGNYDNGHYNYTWDRIQTIDEFVDTVNIANTYACGIFEVENESKITDDAVDALKSQEWVLSFKETEYKVINSTLGVNTYIDKYSTRVSNVTILRLKFETQGIIYDLGVIDNKQTGSLDPSNEFNTTLDLNDMFELILTILLLIVLIAILWPVLPIIFKLLGLLIKIVWWLICLPFKVIGFIFSSDDKGKSKKGNNYGKKKKTKK